MIDVKSLSEDLRDCNDDELLHLRQITVEAIDQLNLALYLVKNEMWVRATQRGNVKDNQGRPVLRIVR